MGFRMMGVPTCCSYLQGPRPLLRVNTINATDQSRSPPCTMLGEDSGKCLVCEEGKIQHPCKLCRAYLYCSKGEF